MGLKSWAVRKLALRWLGGKVKGWKMGGSKLWKFFDGWKTLIGILIYGGVLAWDAHTNGHAASVVSSILVVLGVDLVALEGMVDWPKLIASGVVVLGGIHKLVKAAQQSRAGATPSELLTNEGALREIQTARARQIIRDRAPR